MQMGNGDTGEIVWTNDNVKEYVTDSEIMNAQIPKEILGFNVVARHLNFSSKYEIKKLKLQ